MRKLDQTTIDEREEKILDTARKIIDSEGVGGLTMEKVAARVTFSKGTLYNHFSSREDILVAVSSRCMDKHRQLFARAALFPGRPRERFIAIGVGCELQHTIEPEDHPYWITDDILAKTSQRWRDAYAWAYSSTIELFLGVVRDAIAVGDLPAGTPPDLVSFATWSLMEGADELYRYKLIFRDASPTEFTLLQRRMVTHLLDGFNWKPLSTEIDYPALHRRLIETLYAEEIAQIGPVKDQLFPKG
ncbi:MAG: TetR/AcrR family transcriptional regulator [Verrucomicrobiota bacterium]|nr:TetR/AcrR family transcriptional regulator [Verrucomicrobiota bacterium]